MAEKEASGTYQKLNLRGHSQVRSKSATDRRTDGLNAICNAASYERGSRNKSPITVTTLYLRTRQRLSTTRPGTRSSCETSVSTLSSWSSRLTFCLLLPSDTQTSQLYCNKLGTASPYSTTERRVLELIPVLGSQPAGDASHKPSGITFCQACSYPRNP